MEGKTYGSEPVAENGLGEGGWEPPIFGNVVIRDDDGLTPSRTHALEGDEGREAAFPALVVKY